MTPQLSILHLYPRELDINGDVGNVTALVARAGWRGLAVSVHEHKVGDRLETGVDLVHIGSGPLASQRAVHADLQRIAAGLRVLADSGVPFLAIAGGWQLLGRDLKVGQNELLAGAGVFATSSSVGARRAVGEIVVDTELGRIAGFENHSSTTVLDPGVQPLGAVVSRGSDLELGNEGVREGERVGTNLHGPLLPMNPALADHFLLAMLRRHDPLATLSDLPSAVRVDEFAGNARAAIYGRLGLRAR